MMTIAELIAKLQKFDPSTKDRYLQRRKMTSSGNIILDDSYRSAIVITSYDTIMPQDDCREAAKGITP